MMMNRQRRSLLKVVGISPAAASAGLAHAVMGPNADHAPAGQLLQLRHFARLQGETFRFDLRGVQASAVLQCAEPLPGTTDGEQNFRLVFAPSQAHALGQGTWDVTHPALGTHPIFVSPNDARGAVIEAVFNRQA